MLQDANVFHESHLRVFDDLRQFQHRSPDQLLLVQPFLPLIQPAFGENAVQCLHQLDAPMHAFFP